MLATRRPSFDAGVSLPWDEVLYEELQEENDDELKAIQKEEDEAVEIGGETEVQAARGKRAEYYTKIGDKVCSNRSWRWEREKLIIIAGQSDSSLRSSFREDRHSRC